MPVRKATKRPMSEKFVSGDVVEITILNATVQEVVGQGGPGRELKFSYETKGGPAQNGVFLGWDVRVRQVVPAEGEPRPGDVWTSPCCGTRWFVTRQLDTGNEGVVLVPDDGEEPKAPEYVMWYHGPLRLAYRPSDGEGSDG